MMLAIARRLSRAGVLGLNRRNANYTLRYNPRRHFPLVDNKLRTKTLALEAGIAVPALYGVIESDYQLRHLDHLLAPYKQFALKPACGSGGDGILVVDGREGENFRKIGGALITRGELAFHASNILSGMYSLGGQLDCAFFEHRVQFDPVFDPVSFQGVPDIRIIVFLEVPVMAMVRLPTRDSGGRANLHQGAIGAGIDLATGTTTTAVWKNKRISEHPDTGHLLAGLRIPGWDRLLRLAARCGGLTGLGYIGVDIVLDSHQGPLILELNARPGLNIQIANGAGLLLRLQAVERHHRDLTDVEQRVGFTKTNFGSGA